MPTFKEKQRRVPLKVRLWKHVACGGPQECWPWLGAVGANGYGRTHYYIRGRRVSRNAQQAAWRLTFGAPRRGLYVLHRCDNKLCCNPSHLFLGTNAENTADRHAKGRSARGERAGRALLTESQVLACRERWYGGQSIAALAREHGVSHSAMRYAVNGRNWKHLASGGRHA